MDNQFSVYQFFTTGEYEQVRQFVSSEEAVKAAQHYCTSIGARVMGVVDRVIITDGGDCTVFEWTKTDGITWPKPLQKDIEDGN